MTSLKKGTYLIKQMGITSEYIIALDMEEGKSFEDGTYAMYFNNALQINPPNKLSVSYKTKDNLITTQKANTVFMKDPKYLNIIIMDDLRYHDLNKHFTPGFNDYLIEVLKAKRAIQSYRLGQCMFNIASNLGFNVDYIRGTNADPFYADWMIPTFIKTMWGDEELAVFKETDTYKDLFLKYGKKALKLIEVKPNE